MERYHRIIDFQDNEYQSYTNNMFMFLGFDSKGVDLYAMSIMQALPVQVARPFDAIGSGFDRADSILSDYFENIAREQLYESDPVDGISELLYATTRASQKNIGVGGTPHIAYLNRFKITVPSKKQTQLAVNIVNAAKAGHLPREFQRESVEALVIGGAPFSDVYAEMFKSAKDKNQLMMFQLGYK